ncbi:MAG: SPOR domain-containing protein [Betaproteobacteria bacterium]|nr:SPOR domain-containing protein [Betaproteobacteria bacterium]
MTRDYKQPPRKSGSGGSGSSFLVGVLIGLVAGLGIALAVAWYINKMPSPFVTRVSPPAKAEPAKDVAGKAEEPATKTVEAKPRFDFYKILPGTEEPVTEQQFKDATGRSPAQGKEAFFLQAGAFQSAPDADNLKARLALLGIEAAIQTTTLPDKGTWHRVRVGPYTSTEELNRTRETLKQNGIETALIRVRDAAAQ